MHGSITNNRPKPALPAGANLAPCIRAGLVPQVCIRQLMETDARWADQPAGSPLALGSFAPERWLPGGGSDGRAGAWMPFGAGARMCLGLGLALAEIKVKLRSCSAGCCLFACLPFYASLLLRLRAGCPSCIKPLLLADSPIPNPGPRADRLPHTYAHPPQLIMALLVRKASWEVKDPQEQWDEFPLALPKQGMPLTICEL
jgi:hypothetical protein